MKKQNKSLKLKKSTISELNIEKAEEIKGGITGAYFTCQTDWYCENQLSKRIPCEYTQGGNC